MALHVLPRREDAVAGVVAFSGRLLEPELLADEAQCKPPVLLIHGDQDDVVPPQSQGTGHGIAPDGLRVALAFMQERLGVR